MDPSRRPILPPAKSRPDQDTIELSRQQENQIKDIFNLFDTDGGGTIDRHELNFALVALGFGDKRVDKGNKSKASSGHSMLDEIMADGQVTLEEFTSLMKGELSGKDPWEELRAVFAVLSQDDGNAHHRDLISLDKLKAASRAFHVRLAHEEVEAMIREVDKDGSGTVDFDEFERILRTSAWF